MITLCTHKNPAREELARVEAELEKRPGDRILRGRRAALEREPSRIATWREEEPGILSLPRGVQGIVEEGFAFDSEDVRDVRSRGSDELREQLARRPLELRPDLKPRDYQRRNVARMLESDGGILRSACGSGKSLTFLFFAVESGLPTIVATWSKPLLEQWVGNAIRDLGLRPDEVGVLNDKVERIRPLTIAMVSSCVSRGFHRKYAREFGALLCDEADGYAADTRLEFVDPFECWHRFAASDDERRKDSHEFWLYDLFGPVIDVTSRREAEAAGAIVPVRVRLVETGFAPPAWWSRLSASARGYQQARLFKELAADRDRAALCASLVAEQVRAGRQVIAFAEHVEHVRRLEGDARALLPGLGALGAGLHLGDEVNADERRRTVAGLLTGECKAAFATYKSLGKGINLPSVTRAVLCTPIHGSADRVSQTLGRLNRASGGKSDAEAVVLYDERINGMAPVRAYMRGGREVVVQRRDGKIVSGREYIDDHDEKKRGSASEFFGSLGGE